MEGIIVIYPSKNSVGGDGSGHMFNARERDNQVNSERHPFINEEVEII